MIARQSASERSVRRFGARDRQADRLGAGRKQQAVVGHLAAVGQRDLACAGIDRGDIGGEAQIDAILRVEAVRTERHPVLRRIAGKVVLGEVRPVDRRCVVVAQHHDAAAELLAPQHLGSRKAGSAPADDDDPVRCRAGRPLARLALRLRLLRAHENLAVALLDRPARERGQGRGAHRFPGPQVETGMMPGAADRVADNEPIHQRTVVVRAVGADREHLRPTPHQQNLLVADMAGQLAAIGKLGERNALRQIGPAVLRFVRCHCPLPVRRRVRDTRSIGCRCAGKSSATVGQTSFPGHLLHQVRA